VVGMSDRNSNTQEAGVHVADDAASGNGQSQNSHNPSDEASVAGTGILPLENAKSEIPDAPGTDAFASTAEPIEDNDLHSAVVSTTDGAVLNVDYTLDQLINSTDLFDVPALDFSDDLPT
jgi:hypothetical protein